MRGIECASRCESALQHVRNVLHVSLETACFSAVFVENWVASFIQLLRIPPNANRKRLVTMSTTRVLETNSNHFELESNSR